MAEFSSVQQTQQLLASRSYIADEALATVLFLALRMGRPLFLEGVPGVGKTQLAQTVAEIADTDLIRLQCYEGLDLAQAAYEWNYSKQLLHMQSRGGGGQGTDSLYTREFLLERPLLRSISPGRTRPAVLLIDELDRADEEFESFLLELLSDFQMTIPELGTVQASHRPIVLLTSNRTRQVHDALKRRCLYHWLNYPSLADEVQILQARLPSLSARLAKQIAQFSAHLRTADLNKPPGVAESLDWGAALLQLGVEQLSKEAVEVTAGVVLKSLDDIEQVRGGETERILAEVGE